MLVKEDSHNVPHGRVGHSAKTLLKRTVANSRIAMAQQQRKRPELQEARIQLALQAIKQDATLSQRRAAAIYNVSQTTLSDRRAGKQFRRDCAPNSANLRLIEEEVIV
jgi:DNA-binding transcriptional regulator YiaG